MHERAGSATQGRRRDGPLGFAYNLTRVMNIIGIKPLIGAIAA
jgi:hypothetical protein